MQKALICALQFNTSLVNAHRTKNWSNRIRFCHICISFLLLLCPEFSTVDWVMGIFLLVSKYLLESSNSLILIINFDGPGSIYQISLDQCLPYAHNDLPLRPLGLFLFLSYGSVALKCKPPKSSYRDLIETQKFTKHSFSKFECSLSLFKPGLSKKMVIWITWFSCSIVAI